MLPNVLLKFAAAVTRAVSSASASQKALCVMKLSLLFVTKQTDQQIRSNILYSGKESKKDLEGDGYIQVVK